MVSADRILGVGAEALGCHLSPVPVVVVDISSGLTRLHFEGPPPKREKPPMLEENGSAEVLPPGARWMSPAEKSLLSACDEHWRTRKEIIELSGVVRDGHAGENDCEALLRNLAAAGVLESGQRGFRRKPTA